MLLTLAFAGMFVVGVVGLCALAVAVVADRRDDLEAMHQAAAHRRALRRAVERGRCAR